MDVHLDDSGRPRIIERRFVVPEEFSGFRLDHFLKAQIPRLSRTRLQAIIRTGIERADGRPVKPNARVTAGEQIILRRPAQPEPPCPRDFGVLYDDPHVLVVDKPAGLPVHASAKFYFNTLTRLLSERYPDAQTQIAHRLDRETSGCLVVAKGKRAASKLKKAFQYKRVRKAYLAIVRGVPPWTEEHVIDAPLALVDPRTGKIAVRMEVRPDGLPSETRVRVVERRRDRALVRCVPVTGRQHQIRVHLAHAGYPIVGDKLYAHGDELFARYCDEGLTDELLAEIELPRQALHAAWIEFPHPATREPVAVSSPLPADLRAYLDAR
ncbi:MAG: RluA family pseudouridine synthase [Deltaproteobacteria bacterium]|nr:MAG: RluA family pseudouridine synthase [Deltaproteobacteria bacterium]